MANGSLSRRYARALVELGVEGNCVVRIADDLHNFRDLLDQADGQLRAAMVNPGIAVGERRAVLDMVLQRAELHPLVANYLRLLLDKSRFPVFDDIHRAYQQMADEREGIVRAVVTTARPLIPTMQAQVQKALATSTGKDVRARFATDPALIGGIVAKVGDTVIDASVRARLDQMKKALLTDPAHAHEAAGEA